MTETEFKKLLDSANKASRRHVRRRVQVQCSGWCSSNTTT